MARLRALVAAAAVLVAALACVAADATPTTIYVTVAISKLIDVSIVSSFFKTDMYVLIYFNGDDAQNTPYVNVTDPSDVLALGPPLEFVSAFSSSQDMVIWQFPCVPMDNARLPANVAAAGGNNWFMCQQRVALANSHTFNLATFPFDSHVLKIQIESQAYTSDDVEFAFADNATYGFIDPAVSTQDFSVASAGRNLTLHYYGVFDQTYASVNYYVYIERLSGAYTRRLVVGIVILFCIALFLFLLKPSEINRLIGTLTVFLAIVAYSFVLGQQTPQISYLTRLDRFITLNYGMLMWLVVVHALMFQLAMIARAQRRAKEEVDSLSTVLTQLEANSRANGAVAPAQLESGISMAVLLPPAEDGESTTDTSTGLYPAVELPTGKSAPQPLGASDASTTARRRPSPGSTGTYRRDSADPDEKGARNGGMKDAKELKLAERRWISEHRGDRCFNMRYVIRFKLRVERWADMFFVVITTVVYGVLSWQLLVTDSFDE